MVAAATTGAARPDQPYLGIDMNSLNLFGLMPHVTVLTEMIECQT